MDDHQKGEELCRQCGQVERAPGHTLCLDCLICKREKNKEYWQKHREELLPKAVLRSKARSEDLYSKGLCVQCGKREHLPGKKHCQRCLNKAKIRSKKRYARDTRKGIHISFQIRKESGICLRCNEQAVNGYSLCQKHLELARKAARMGRKAAHALGDKRVFRILNDADGKALAHARGKK